MEATAARSVATEEGDSARRILHENTVSLEEIRNAEGTVALEPEKRQNLKRPRSGLGDNIKINPKNLV
jgi:hypothetical protein